MGTGLTADCYTVGKLKVTDTLMALFFAGINALIFSGTNYSFGKSGPDDAEGKSKHII